MIDWRAGHLPLPALLLAMAVLLAGLCGGARPGFAADTDFSTADVNQDGRVDRIEYEKRMVDVFYLADVNKDGVLEISEVIVSERPAFTAADTDGNGRVTLREFVILRLSDFDAADLNKDGVLSTDEVAAWSSRR